MTPLLAWSLIALGAATASLIHAIIYGIIAAIRRAELRKAGLL